MLRDSIGMPWEPLGWRGGLEKGDKTREVPPSQMCWLLKSNQVCLRFKTSRFGDNRFEMWIPQTSREESVLLTLCFCSMQTIRSFPCSLSLLSLSSF